MDWSWLKLIMHLLNFRLSELCLYVSYFLCNVKTIAYSNVMSSNHGNKVMATAEAPPQSKSSTFLNFPYMNSYRMGTDLLYIGNRPRKKKFANFASPEAFANVFLHFLILAGIFIYEIA